MTCFALRLQRRFVRSEASSHGVTKALRTGLISLEARYLFKSCLGCTGVSLLSTEVEKSISDGW